MRLLLNFILATKPQRGGSILRCAASALRASDVRCSSCDFASSAAAFSR
jgi:hypothetical protein